MTKHYESENEYNSDINTLDEKDVDNYCGNCESCIGKDFLHDFTPNATVSGNIRTWCESCINTYSGE